MHFKDPRSGVYNVDPGLEEMMPIRDFNFDSLVLFVPPSRDMVLAKIAKEVEKRYVASTSSLTGVLKHFHFLLSRFRRPNVETVSKSFPIAHEVTYSKISHAPDAVFLRYRDGMYAVDADKEFDRGNILSLMGRLMEKLLTVDPARFERHRRDTADPISEEEMSEPEAYHYSVAGEFLLRSQLDAHDPRLPGSGMFDLKTRAVVPIRMDVEDFEWGMKYEIRGLYGQWQSFEREYYDMIRSTILKYSLQARMGRMDGIFVAYHNIARIFGFQYISLAEMDAVIHGQSDTSLGDQEFLVSMQMLSDVVNRAVKKYPNQVCLPLLLSFWAELTICYSRCVSISRRERPSIPFCTPLPSQSTRPRLKKSSRPTDRKSRNGRKVYSPETRVATRRESWSQRQTSLRKQRLQLTSKPSRRLVLLILVMKLLVRAPRKISHRMLLRQAYTAPSHKRPREHKSKPRSLPSPPTLPSSRISVRQRNPRALCLR